MHVFPADGVASLAGGVGVGAVVVLLSVADAPAGAAFDPAELLDVDVHELASPRALVALRLLESDPAEPAHPLPLQDRRHRRERHRERLSDLSCCHPQLPQ